MVLSIDRLRSSPPQSTSQGDCLQMPLWTAHEEKRRMGEKGCTGRRSGDLVGVVRTALPSTRFVALMIKCRESLREAKEGVPQKAVAFTRRRVTSSSSVAVMLADRPLEYSRGYPNLLGCVFREGHVRQGRQSMTNSRHTDLKELRQPACFNRLLAMTVM